MKCPFCGSTNISAPHKEVYDSHTIRGGLPKTFTNDEWFYYVCKDCFKRAREHNWKGTDFVFTLVNGEYFLFIGEKKIWVNNNKEKEVVQFT